MTAISPPALSAPPPEAGVDVALLSLELSDPQAATASEAAASAATSTARMGWNCMETPPLLVDLWGEVRLGGGGDAMRRSRSGDGRATALHLLLGLVEDHGEHDHGAL